jgi:hypothetical protein
MASKKHRKRIKKYYEKQSAENKKTIPKQINVHRKFERMFPGIRKPRLASGPC